MLLYKDANQGIKDIDKKKNIVVGHAAHFGNVDSHGDIIRKGAFKRTIQHNASRIKVLQHHDPVYLVGKPLKMEEDDEGLYTESHISKTAQGIDLLTLLEDGVLDEMSIGYMVVDEEMDSKAGVNYLNEVKLVEYSFVTLASNPEARVQGLKSDEAILKTLESMKRMEKALRDGVFLSDEVPEHLEFALGLWRKSLDATLKEMVAKTDVVKSSEPNGDSGEPTHPHDDDSADATRSELLGFLNEKQSEYEIQAMIRRFGDSLGGKDV